MKAILEYSIDVGFEKQVSDTIHELVYRYLTGCQCFRIKPFSIECHSEYDQLNKKPYILCEIKENNNVGYTCNEFSGRTEQCYKNEIKTLKDEKKIMEIEHKKEVDRLKKEIRNYSAVDLNDVIKYKGFELVVTAMENGKVKTVEELDKLIAKTRVINVDDRWITIQEYIDDCK